MFVKIKNCFRLLMLAIMLPVALLLAGCDALDEYISSGGEQDFTRYTPGVANTTPDNSDTPDDAPDDSGDSSTTVPVPSVGGGSGGSSEDDSDDSENDGDNSGDADEGDANDVDAPSLLTTGIVWKPVSEGDGHLVVLTPTSYGTPSIVILDASGRVVESGRYVGHTNGDRATYRFSRAGGGYSSPAFLRVDGNLFKVANTSARYN